MIITKIQGGLGNQMFQYACGKNLALKHNQELKLDISWYEGKRPKEDTPRAYQLDTFSFATSTSSPIMLATKEDMKRFSIISSSKILRKLLSISGQIGERISHIVMESNNMGSYNLDVYKPSTFLNGFWQNKKYFEDISDTIRDNFTSFREEMSENAKSMLTKINSLNSICVNYRRTDYVSSKAARGYHGIMGEEYYSQAIKMMAEKVKDPHFFIFSDDIEWCLENVKIGFPTTFITREYSGKEYIDYFRLMIACKNYIIPNSTFAWWPAWLNKNPNKIVIAPKRWYVDMDGKEGVASTNWIQI